MNKPGPKDDKLTHSQERVLQRYVNSDSKSLSALAEELGIHRDTVWRVLKSPKAQAYLERMRDKQMKLGRVSAQGLKRNITTLKQISDEIADRIEQGGVWTGDDIKAMSVISDRLLGVVKAAVELGLDPESSDPTETENEALDEIETALVIGIALASHTDRDREDLKQDILRHYLETGCLSAYNVPPAQEKLVPPSLLPDGVTELEEPSRLPDPTPLGVVIA